MLYFSSPRLLLGLGARPSLGPNPASYLVAHVEAQARVESLLGQTQAFKFGGWAVICVCLVGSSSSEGLESWRSESSQLGLSLLRESQMTLF